MHADRLAMRRARICLVAAMAVFGGAWATPGRAADAVWRFSFRPMVDSGHTLVGPEIRYTEARGYGFEPDIHVPAPGVAPMPATAPAIRTAETRGAHHNPRENPNSMTSEQPFIFSVRVAEGNYRVRVRLGDPNVEGNTTVKAEARRLMLDSVRTAAGDMVTKTFLVNVRRPALPGGGSVKLDPREPGSFTWDDKLSIQFSGGRVALSDIQIEKVNDAGTVFLCGDSTVTDQPREPYGTWGMMLPRFFGPGVAVANHAESGQTVKGFSMERRWEKVMSQVKAGDYVFLQFGHNDLNRTGRNALWPAGDPSGDWSKTHSEAGTDYKRLLKEYAAEVKGKGATPVIVSPMMKIDIRTGALNEAGLRDYPKAAVEAAQDAGIACIDLNAMSVALVKGLGPENARRAYVDGLHTNSYGGYLLARCMAEGMRKEVPALATLLAPDAGTFDLDHPQPLPEEFRLPLEPSGRLNFGGRSRGPATAPATRPN
jgi:lysophospholipase L1-like esterase